MVFELTPFSTISELLNLKVNHIDLKKNLITIHSGKGRKTRRIPILQNQKPVLKQLLKIRLNYLSLDSPESFFLINKKGKRPSVNWLQNYYIRISKIINIHVYAHRLRRTFASILFFDYNIDI
ncbi:MAG: tyrosine-type recombinase/integrase [Candidatus Heimdallarchaeota archaeon]